MRCIIAEEAVGVVGNIAVDGAVEVDSEVTGAEKVDIAAVADLGVIVAGRGDIGDAEEVVATEAIVAAATVPLNKQATMDPRGR